MFLTYGTNGKTMQYKGFEIQEMNPEHWDGKTRQMFVWSDDASAPLVRTVVGFDTLHHVWLIAETQAVWPHCAELALDVNESLACVTKKFNEATELCRKSLLLILSLTNDRGKIEPADVAGQVDYLFSQLKILEGKTDAGGQPQKRIMTNRQLSEWLGKGNGECIYGGSPRRYTSWHYLPSEESEPAKNVMIRAWDATEWRLPLKD